MTLKEIRNHIVSEPVTNNMLYGLGQKQQTAMIQVIDELIELVGQDFFVGNSIEKAVDQMDEILGAEDGPADSESIHQIHLLEEAIAMNSRYEEVA
jgi:uncharacterized protein (UPF0147 family)